MTFLKALLFWLDLEDSRGTKQMGVTRKSYKKLISWSTLTHLTLDHLTSHANLYHVMDIL